MVFVVTIVVNSKTYCGFRKIKLFGDSTIALAKGGDALGMARTEINDPSIINNNDLKVSRFSNKFYHN